ncbi:MAG: DUF3320 domain-containing protein [Planctomycetes bacterium]|nr:DUF3320 domain-containing protein [Planctomycetota bacterium]
MFVKNLENVQGDERDVILFSVCYGPDAAGKVAMNFGPLNLPGGERRLNVAVTRARRQVVVHATLTPDRIDLSRTNAVGVRHLKTFLEYAGRGPAALAEAVALSGDAAVESPFEEGVRDALVARGHDVAVQVGCAGYRIDLAVRDPERKGRFLLGIECDGAFYHSARTARDRDRLRQSVLEGLGWRLVRIWSTDWWRSPERELQRVEAAIELARRDAVAEREAERPTEPALEPATAPAEPVGEVDEVAEVAEPAEAAEPTAVRAPERIASAPVTVAAPAVPAVPVYEVAALDTETGEADLIHTPKADEQLDRFVRRVLAAEAPLARDLLHRRIALAFGARLTARVRERIDACLAALPVDARPHDVDGFLWRPDQSPAEFTGFRTGGDRDALDIPPIEVANAAASILATQIAMPRADLARETARLFGFSRMGSRVESSMTRGLDLLVSLGRARPDADRLALP